MPRCAQPGRPRSWSVSSNPGSTTSSTVQAGTNRTRSPGARSAGGSRRASQIGASVRPMRCQPARRGEWIDAGLATRDGDAPGRDPDARGRAPGKGELLREDPEVGEPGHEPDEEDPVLGPGVEGDDVGLGASRPFRDLGEVGSVETPVAHRDLDQPARRRWRAAESAAEGGPDRRAGRRLRHHVGVERQEDARVGGHGGPEAPDGGAWRGELRDDTVHEVVDVRRDLVAEGQQEGGVAHPVDARARGQLRSIRHRARGRRSRRPGGRHGPRGRPPVRPGCRRGCRACRPRHAGSATPSLATTWPSRAIPTAWAAAAAGSAWTAPGRDLARRCPSGS